MFKSKWTKEDLEYLLDNYKEKSSKEIALYLGKSSVTINRKIKSLGLIDYGRKTWTDDEVLYLKENIETKNVKEMSLELNRSEVSIHSKLNLLGFNFGRYKTLTKDEEFYLLTNYKNTPNKEICKHLNISIHVLKRLCKELNLSKEKEYKNVKYSDEEVSIIIEHKHLPTSEILKLLPNKKACTLLPKMKELGIERNRSNMVKPKITKYKVIDGMLECRKCHLIKKYNDDNFDIKKGLSTCKECKKKHHTISYYKKSYGLILDWDKMLDTYSPEEWVDIYLKNNMTSYPPLYINKEKLIRMVRYVVFEKLKISEREVILNLSREKLQPFNLISSINTFFDGWYDTVNSCFYDFEIKPFELFLTPQGYLSNIDNADYYMNYELDNFIENNSMENISYKLSSYFNRTNLIKEGKYNLVSVISNHKLYRNFYEWISKLRPDWNINEKDFNYCISNIDSSVFDSLEERDVYDFMLNNNIDIKSVGKKRNGNQYYNDEYQESYYPDFIIEECNKASYILEYFGLYLDNPKTKMSNTYKSKADRKIKYFSSLKDIIFIPIYPNDLKYNFEGLRSKLIENGLIKE